MITLRPDQMALKLGAYEAWNSGLRNVLVQLATGGGKSIVMSDLVLDGHMQNLKQVVIAHRTELVSQLSMHIAKRGIHHAIIAPKKTIKQIINQHRRAFAGKSFVRIDANCSVGGVDTIKARHKDLKAWAEQQHRWFIDEAHHVLRKNKWGFVVAMFKNAFGCGVTATPERADGCGIGSHADGVFDRMVNGLTMRQLIDKDALCDYEICIPESDYEIDDSALGASGDYSHKKMKQESQRSKITGDVVWNYMLRALGKKAIVFTTDVETSNNMARKFNDAGIPAASISAETPSEVRENMVERFKDGRLTVLVNVDLFGEGFDVPAVEVVIMARPTASLAVYLQQFGRVLRTMAGKLYGLVIDHVSNWKRHGWPDKPRVWTMDRRDKRAKKEPDPDDVPLVACKNIACGKPYDKVLLACPHCGEIPIVEIAERGSIQQVEGNLILLDRDALAKMRALVELENPDAIANRVGFVAGDFAAKGVRNKQILRIETQQKLQDRIDEWAGWQRYMGRSDQESYRRFYEALKIDTITALTLKTQEMQNLIETIEKWIEKCQITNNQLV